jgi:hypothetical protein
MLAGGGVGPFAGGAAAGFGSLESDEHRAARCVAHVADEPITALAPAIEEIMTAHRLGFARETVRQVGSIARHHAASRSPMRSTGKRSSTLVSTPTPLASVGTNMRSFQVMISWKSP